MDIADLSDERRAPQVIARYKSNLVFDRRARSPLGRGVRDGLVTTREAEAPEAADHSQAAYFLRVLGQNRRVGDERIEKYQRALAIAQADGDVEGASGFRRLLRGEEQDRQLLDDMIEKLQRRFPSRIAGEGRSTTSKAQLAVSQDHRAVVARR
jgi:hypothetical protein